MATKYLDYAGLSYLWQKIKAYGDSHWGGSGDATATPTANKAAKFDANAKMNSTDMTSAEVKSFVDGLDNAGGTAYTYITTFNTGWALYDSAPVVLRRSGNVVNLSGAVKNTATITLDATWSNVFVIPTSWTDFIPKETDILTVCQGSTTNRYLCALTISGQVRFARYTSGTTYSSISAGAWFPFNITWIAQ